MPKMLEGEQAKEWVEKVRDPGCKAIVERVFVIRVEAFDWNCQQHIIPRFTEDEIGEALAPLEGRMQRLENENKKLRDEIVRPTEGKR